MKGFLQEYGIYIVTVVVVLAFITLASVFGDKISAGVKDITADLFARTGITVDIGGEEVPDNTTNNTEPDNDQSELCGGGLPAGCILPVGHEGPHLHSGGSND